MGSLSSMVWKDVLGKRWITCAVCQVLISSVGWMLWEAVFGTCVFRSCDTNGVEYHILSPSLWTGLRFVTFQASSMFFLLGRMWVLETGRMDAISVKDVASGVLRLVLGAFVGRSQKDQVAIHELKRKVHVAVVFAVFCIISIISGVLALFSLTSPTELARKQLNGAVEIGIRGAVLGLAYAGLQFCYRGVVLEFPIIQRRLPFALKIGIPGAMRISAKLALAVLPLGEALLQMLQSESGLDLANSMDDYNLLYFLLRQFMFAAEAFYVMFCWEVCNHLVQDWYY